MSQTELAKALNVSQGTVSRWENGKQEPDQSNLDKLVRLAGITDVASSASSGDSMKTVGFSAGGCVDVRIVGATDISAWVSTKYWDYNRQFTMNLPLPEKWHSREIIGFLIDDDYADYYYKNGSVVFIAKFDKNAIRPQPGDVMVFAESADGGLYNITIREYLDLRKDNPSAGGAETNDILLSSPTYQNEGWDLTLGTSVLNEAAQDGTLEDIGFLGVVVAAFNIVLPDRLPLLRADPLPPASSGDVKRVPRRPPPAPDLSLYRDESLE